MIEHLGQLDFLHGRENVLLLGPPGTGKTHLAIALSIRACLAGQRVQLATATQWVARLGEAKRQGSLEAELRKLGFIPLIVVDLCRSCDYADLADGCSVNDLVAAGLSMAAPAGLSA